jgi:minor histocompatibility antigen H13
LGHSKYIFENGPDQEDELRKYKIPFIDDHINAFEIVCFILGYSISIAWALTKNYMLNNLLGVILCIVFLKSIRLNQLLPGVVLLTLLFFYDIFWVFISPKFTGGQSVMMSVATRFEAPIKLMVPHLMGERPSTNCSMLGLGDIVIPGIYIGYLIRFARLMTITNLEEIKKNDEALPMYSTLYRNAALTAYLIALLICGTCLWMYHTA